LDELQDHYDEIKNYDAIILAVSVKPAETNKKIRDKFGLEYPMLCDVPRQAVNVYGILDGKGDVRPSTFIVDKKGTVTWRYIGKSDKDIVYSSVILEKLQEINQY